MYRSTFGSETARMKRFVRAASVRRSSEPGRSWTARSIRPTAQQIRQAVISLREQHRSIAIIAGERFVTAIAIQRDGYMAASLARDVVSRNRRRIGVRLAVVFDQRRQYFERIRPDDEFVVIGADVFRHAPRMMQLAEILFFKSN